MPTDTLATPAVHPVARYMAEPHTELSDCYQVVRHSPHRPKQRVGNYTDHRAAEEVAQVLNKFVNREAP